VVYAHKLRNIAETFSRDDMEKIGASKLGIVLQLPEPQRARLLTHAREGATRSELEAAKGKPRPPATVRDAAATVKAARNDKVTIAMVEGRVTLPLFARQSSKKDVPKPARKLTEDPWTEERLENNVIILYRVKTNEKGEMILIVERRRPPLANE
jgi:hypothetical protein